VNAIHFFAFIHLRSGIVHMSGSRSQPPSEGGAEKSANFTVRLPREQLLALRQIAAQQERSVNWLITKAIAEFLKGHEPEPGATEAQAAERPRRKAPRVTK
jgi:predicted transcriptional regulator